MSCWFAIPSCRTAPEATACFNRWRERGYSIAVLRQGEAVEADLHIHTSHYLGWSRSTNILARHILRIDPEAQWIVGGGDDYWPCAVHTADYIARETTAHFGGTFGVMQPTGDRWGDDARSRSQYGEGRGAYIDRVAGSPWMGRNWILHSYLGNGPMWDGYHHCFADEELQEVASKLGVFQQRRELEQFHAHPGKRSFSMENWPPHLAPAITGANWDRDQTMFRERKLKGFPGSEPLPR